MQPIRVRDAQFRVGATTIESLPPGDLPEIAFAGRSNVGKSSMLRTLLGRRALVRTSRSPGRTRQINIFQVDLVDHPSLSFGDLPGYGYARVSKAERLAWGPLIETYLETRQNLRAVVVIVDARRGAEDDDLQLAEYLDSIHRPLVVVATKIDKLAKSAVHPRVTAIGKTFGVRALPFSAETGAGREELWQRLLHEAGLIVRM